MKGNVSVTDNIEGPRITVNALINRAIKDVDKSLADNNRSVYLEPVCRIKWARRANLRSRDRVEWVDARPWPWQGPRKIVYFEYITHIPVPGFVLSSVLDELQQRSRVERAPFLRKTGEREQIE